MTERKQIFKQVGTALAVGTLLSFIGELIYGIILGLNPEWITNGTIVLMISSISIWITKYPVAAWMMSKLPRTKNKKVHLTGNAFVFRILYPNDSSLTGGVIPLCKMQKKPLYL